MLSWLPLIIAASFIWFVARKLWVSIAGGLIIYFLLATGLAIGTPIIIFSTAFEAGDAQIIAEAISESLVTYMLRMIVDLPLLALIMAVANRRLKNQLAQRNLTSKFD